MKAWKAVLCFGIMCIFSAGGLTAYNLYDAERAGRDAWAALSQVDKKIAASRDESTQTKAVEGIDTVPDYVIDRNTPMGEVEIDGRMYIGRIDVPELGISLPVGSKLSDDGLRYAPCRYTGSVYTGRCVIAGHDYRTHFGPLSAAVPGMDVLFTDVDGNVFTYTVLGTDTVGMHDFEGAFDGDWDLTLFTCTISGRERLMVRCGRVSEGVLM